jgi:hypothetical protein
MPNYQRLKRVLAGRLPFNKGWEVSCRTPENLEFSHSVDPEPNFSYPARRVSGNDVASHENLRGPLACFLVILASSSPFRAV